MKEVYHSALEMEDIMKQENKTNESVSMENLSESPENKGFSTKSVSLFPIFALDFDPNS